MDGELLPFSAAPVSADATGRVGVRELAALDLIAAVGRNSFRSAPPSFLSISDVDSPVRPLDRSRRFNSLAVRQWHVCSVVCSLDSSRTKATSFPSSGKTLNYDY